MFNTRLGLTRTPTHAYIVTDGSWVYGQAWTRAEARELKARVVASQDTTVVNSTVRIYSAPLSSFVFDTNS